MPCIFTVDVEDWFHVLDLPTTPPMSQWETLPARVERNFETLLELLRERDVAVTCFFLGWIAKRYPQLVRRAVEEGHEIASHGFSHQLVYEQSEQQFYDDIRRAKDAIEDAGASEVIGYRCPGFSITEETPWAFERIVAAGYRYDSSIFPAARGHGGMRNAPMAPHLIETPSGSLVEVPISVARLFGRRVCLFGGGYLRLSPLALIRYATKAVLRESRPVLFYLHPREIDPEQPRLEMGAVRHFKSYVNLRTTRPKLRSLLGQFSFVTLAQYIDTQPHLASALVG